MQLCAHITTCNPLIGATRGPSNKLRMVGVCTAVKIREIPHSSAGTTTKSNLSRGLGHFALFWASVLGAETDALSHSPDKEKDALALGAKNFICTKDKDWATLRYSPLIVSRTFSTLRNICPPWLSMNTSITSGFLMIQYPKASAFGPKGAQIGASHSGSRPDMLKFEVKGISSRTSKSLKLSRIARRLWRGRRSILKRFDLSRQR